VEHRYRIGEYDPPWRVALESRVPGFVSRDMITVAAAEHGSTVGYEALLTFSGTRRLETAVQSILDRVGDGAKAGRRSALKP